MIVLSPFLTITRVSLSWGHAGLSRSNKNVCNRAQISLLTGAACLVMQVARSIVSIGAYTKKHGNIIK